MNFLSRSAENILERMLLEQFWQLLRSMDFQKWNLRQYRITRRI